MTQCLSEFEVLGYVRGAVNDQQRSVFDEHLSSCTGCKARVEQVRDSSVHLDSMASHQAATQVEMTSAVDASAARSRPDSNRADGDIASPVAIESPVAAPKVSLDDLLTGLSQSGLLPRSDVAGVRDRSHKDPTTSTVAGLIEWLVREQKL